MMSHAWPGAPAADGATDVLQSAAPSPPFSPPTSGGGGHPLSPMYHAVFSNLTSLSHDLGRTLPPSSETLLLVSTYVPVAAFAILTLLSGARLFVHRIRCDSAVNLLTCRGTTSGRANKFWFHFFLFVFALSRLVASVLVVLPNVENREPGAIVNSLSGCSYITLLLFLEMHWREILSPISSVKARRVLLTWASFWALNVGLYLTVIISVYVEYSQSHGTKDLYWSNALTDLLLVLIAVSYTTTAIALYMRISRSLGGRRGGVAAGGASSNAAVKYVAKGEGRAGRLSRGRSGRPQPPRGSSGWPWPFRGTRWGSSAGSSAATGSPSSSTSLMLGGGGGGGGEYPRDAQQRLLGDAGAGGGGASSPGREAGGGGAPKNDRSTQPASPTGGEGGGGGGYGSGAAFTYGSLSSGGRSSGAHAAVGTAPRAGAPAGRGGVWSPSLLRSVRKYFLPVAGAGAGGGAEGGAGAPANSSIPSRPSSRSLLNGGGGGGAPAAAASRGGGGAVVSSKWGGPSTSSSVASYSTGNGRAAVGGGSSGGINLSDARVLFAKDGSTSQASNLLLLVVGVQGEAPH